MDTLALEPTELVGTRVKLIPMTMAHVQALHDASQSPAIWDYMPTKVQTLDDMNEFVQTAQAAQSRGVELPFVVLDRKSNTIVGATRYLNVSEANRQLEIGWTWYTPEVWRTRVNTECKYLLLRHAFEDLDTIRVQLCTDGRNRRSQEAILRLGATHEGVLRKHRILSDEYVRDTWVYSILQEEWGAVRSRLESALNTTYT